ncbi:MAG: Smr/MutS family protein [Chloroflexi bacterium]|nr:Smr/MutS family protein [Chloroflexota bacterium]MCI0812388.1 Smr/MutS family protein [Chloroflexota bacterium]MCI0822466.1 Smr/MutS family protein [Chloroflexota bacterium]
MARRYEKSRLLGQLSVETEVHLRRMPVRQAMDKLDRYLNDAVMAGYPWVRVVHGKGTGTMREAVRDFLSKHPLVVRHRPAAPNEGNGGVTIAELQ